MIDKNFDILYMIIAKKGGEHEQTYLYKNLDKCKIMSNIKEVVMKKIFMTGILAIGFVAGGWIRVVGTSISPIPPEKEVTKSTASEVVIRATTLVLLKIPLQWMASISSA